MSRVFKDQKHVNMPKRNSATNGPSKIAKSFGPSADYTKVQSLSDWLYLKYGMSYKQFNGKSKNRKDALRAEYFEDTGRVPGQNNKTKRHDYTNDYDDDWDEYDCDDGEWTHDDVLSHFADIGVPISEDGTPLGIGWD